MKMLGVQCFILLLRILSGYNIMLCLILLVSHFFNSDFYFQPSDPFHTLTPSVLNVPCSTKELAKQNPFTKLIINWKNLNQVEILHA